MPGGLASTREALTFLRDEISPRTYVNIMAQYHVAWQAAEHEEIGKRVAIKVLKPEILRDVREVARFEREIDQLAAHQPGGAEHGDVEGAGR